MVKKVLLTGATGFLGSHLAESLITSGYAVRALVRNPHTSSLNQQANLEIAIGDICQPNTLTKAVIGIDYVIHCAGAVKAYHSDLFYQVNTQGTRYLLEAVLKASHPIKRFVHLSSLAAAGPHVGDEPQRLIDQSIPVSHYGRSKLEAEKIIYQQYVQKMPITIIRPPAIYGPGDQECLAFFKLVQWHLWPSFLSKNKRVSLIYVQDAADAILCAMQNDQNSGNSYFIDDGHKYLIHDLIEVLKQTMQVKRVFNVRIPLLLLSWISSISEKYAKAVKKPTMISKDKLSELMQQDWTCNSQLANQQLGWHANTDWKAGVLKTLTWYQQAGWIK